jgi:lipoprotein-anchoring transpeptidase ErfK/SrfK
VVVNDSGGSSAASVVRSLTSGLVYLVVLAFAATAVSLVVSPGRDAAASGERGRGKEKITLASLKSSTTRTTIPRAPKDPDPQGVTDGEVVHPLRTVMLYAQPGRHPFAKVTPQQFGDTWLPVVERRGAWSRVLLPSRPNGSTGWLRTAQVERRTTPYLIRVHLGSRQLELFSEGSQVGSWTVAIGAPETPTPTGRTFLLGSMVDDSQSFSPLILPLGSHSDTLDSYGGGPGTVALHGWPDDSVFGQAVSHGCIRVPAEALEALRYVPLGTLVVVDEQ